MLELAPEAVLARDLDLVKEIFEVFDSETRHDKIEGWFVRGKVDPNPSMCLLAKTILK